MSGRANATASCAKRSTRALRHGGDELNAAFHEFANEGYVSSEPVELGYHEPRLEPLAGGAR